MKTKPARDRLSEKNCRGLLVNHLRTRYAFSPAMADVLAEDALYLRTISAPGSRQDGQIMMFIMNVSNIIMMMSTNSVGFGSR